MLPETGLRQIPTSPVALPGAVVAGDTWRITVLTDALVRIEHAPDGHVEDRASAFALHRDLPVADFTVHDTGTHVEIVTARLRLTYDKGPLTTSGLSVEALGGLTAYESVWRPEQPRWDREGNSAGLVRLAGTARTLDTADGAVELEDGVVSQTGVVALDDSGTLLLTDDGWVAPRPAGATDLYVFAYGHDYRGAVRDLYRVSGPTPLLPRFALGSWWSRYFPYTADGYRELMERFTAEGIPFSVSVIDMDWHVVDVPARFGSGWTGYSWNRDLFPDPPAFLAWLHEHGLRVTLNVHPADGVRAFEDAYPEMAAALGRATGDEAPIQFDVTDRAFLEAYLDVLHRGLERDGVDLWWLDWQSGPHSRVAGIDPLWMLNHVHFLDNADRRRGRERRPLTFSRYAGPGSHRYPVGFSGDTAITWASLDFQPYFTASASNIGYGWWSHDVGGHMHGVKDDELATRWVQLGVLSPIMRLHSGNNPFTHKEPWAFGAEAQRVQTAFLRLRHRLVPYLHTMNHRAALGSPLVEPMYWEHPEDPEAYRVPNQFRFGTELLVAPVTQPADRRAGRASVRAWLPDGTWVDVLTGVVYDGGREIVLWRGLASVPVLAAPGAVVPLDGAHVPANGAEAPRDLEVVVVAGADGAFDLLEDDGSVPGPAGPTDVPTLVTPLRWEQASGTLTVGPVATRGDAAAARTSAPDVRTWTVLLPAVDLGWGGTATATVDGRPAGVHVDAFAPLPGETGATGLGVRVADVPADARLTITLQPAHGGVALAGNDAGRLVFELLDEARIEYDLKSRVMDVATSDRPLAVRLAHIEALGLEPALRSALVEVLTARG
ncbi:TIM-barrel domain-containing protein [Sanguibacter sp. A247]|uniref:TIM-barrel domain-containing protein n=1 Tax=unclassified Sanguibacter TaxID=2645534 RepID=UPI003FD76E0D